jgi:hypothetical protein
VEVYGNIVVEIIRRKITGELVDIYTYYVVV